MLPFLKKDRSAGLIIAHRKPDGSNELGPSEGDESAPLEACAEELIRAVHAKDAKAVASALQSAFEIADSMPHAEGEHIENKEE